MYRTLLDWRPAGVKSNVDACRRISGRFAIVFCGEQTKKACQHQACWQAFKLQFAAMLLHLTGH
jgi:hypothetical protein